MGSLDPSRISHLSPSLELLDGDPPTKEIPLHTAFYETRPLAKAVVHLHSTYATLLSMLPGIDPDNVLPPLTPYAIMLLGKVKLLPFFLPGDASMGQAVKDLKGEHAAIILANHGPVVSGASLERAAYAFEELEETAKLAVLSTGLNPRLLTQDQVAAIEQKYPIGK
jgi:ribulose-5-phosphate 4-epimerase/fuculose-1-phosphate aldolase